MPRLVRILLFCGVVFSTPTWAGTHCPEHYPNRVAPEITRERMADKTREVCFSAFGIMHSGVTRTALWSAEHLTRTSLADAKMQSRANAFHVENKLPASERSELEDYQRSGYDRGHLAPSADMPNPAAQHESFTLANMVPQNSDNNRKLWAGLESAVRALARDRGELYVITGPLFLGNRLQQLRHRVLVPTHLYKLVYDPSSREGAAYLTANEATSEYRVLSVGELEKISGIVFFPRTSRGGLTGMLTLPAPDYRGKHSGSGWGSALQQLLPRRQP